jgi:colanic acid/amylovoran biosynthesis glycosyltransferase
VQVLADRDENGYRPVEWETHRLATRTTYLGKVPVNKAHRLKQAAGTIGRSLVTNPWLTLRSLDVFTHGKAAASLELFLRQSAFDRCREFDVLQAHFGPSGIAALQMRDLGLITGKLITTFHGYDISTLLRRKGDDLYADLFRRGDFFTPVSEFFARKLQRLGCPPEKIAVHHMGIDVNRFTFRPRTWQPGQTLRLVSTARLTEKKGLAYAIQAVGLLAEQGLDVHYQIIGGGDERMVAHLRSRAIEVGAGDRVELLGAIENTAIAPLLDAAHLLICPSVTAQDGDEEGCPLAIQEAMAAGLPCIGTRHGGIPELIDDGETGLLVPQRDSVAIARAVRQLIDHVSVWPRLTAAARAKVMRQHDVKRLNRRLSMLFSTLARRDTPVPRAA